MGERMFGWLVGWMDKMDVYHLSFPRTAAAGHPARGRRARLVGGAPGEAPAVDWLLALMHLLGV